MNWSAERTGAAGARFFEGTWNALTLTLPKPAQLDRLSVNGQPLISGMTG